MGKVILAMMVDSTPLILSCKNEAHWFFAYKQLLGRFEKDVLKTGYPKERLVLHEYGEVTRPCGGFLKRGLLFEATLEPELTVADKLKRWVGLK